MTWQFNPYAIPLLAAAIAMLALTALTWRYRAEQSARYFLVFMFSVSGLMFAYTLELLASSLPLILACLKIEYIFSLSVPILFFLFILSYNHYDAWITQIGRAHV